MQRLRRRLPSPDRPPANIHVLLCVLLPFPSLPCSAQPNPALLLVAPVYSRSSLVALIAYDRPKPRRDRRTRTPTTSPQRCQPPTTTGHLPCGLLVHTRNSRFFDETGIPQGFSRYMYVANRLLAAEAGYSVKSMSPFASTVGNFKRHDRSETRGSLAIAVEVVSVHHIRDPSPCTRSLLRAHPAFRCKGS